MTARLFISTIIYSASKALGYRAANDKLFEHLSLCGALIHHPRAPWSGLPCALTIARAASLEDAMLNVNAGATVIGKARSLAAFEFLSNPDCDVWLSIDDDVTVTLDALDAMVQQARAEPCVVLAPCLLRSTLADGPPLPYVGLVPSLVTVDSKAPNGARLESVESGGFGCFAVSRGVIERAHELAGVESEWEHEGKTLRALFRDQIHERKWETEDLSFLRRFVRPHFRIWAVRVGESVHCGQRLDLGTLEAIGLGVDNGEARGHRG